MKNFTAVSAFSILVLCVWTFQRYQKYLWTLAQKINNFVRFWRKLWENRMKVIFGIFCWFSNIGKTRKIYNLDLESLLTDKSNLFVKFLLHIIASSIVWQLSENFVMQHKYPRKADKVRIGWTYYCTILPYYSISAIL